LALNSGARDFQVGDLQVLVSQVYCKLEFGSANEYPCVLNYNRYIHNQTGDIYTQVLGVLIMGIIGRDLFRMTEARFVAASQEDFIVSGCFLFSIIICLLLSFIFYTICNHSQEAQQLWLNLDFMGLLIAASGGFVPGI